MASKRKSNAQKRAKKARQEANRIRNQKNFRKILFRDFSDMKPWPPWKIALYEQALATNKKLENWKKEISQIKKKYAESQAKARAAEAKRREILFRKFTNPPEKIIILGDAGQPSLGDLLREAMYKNEGFAVKYI